MLKAYPSIIVIIFAVLLAACSGGSSSSSLPFVENFDDEETCLNRDVASFGVLEIENGEFIIGVNAVNQLVWSTCEEIVLDNFTFEMDFYDETNGEGFRFIGLQFRKGPVNGGSNQYYLVRFGMGGSASPTSCVGMASDNSWIDNLTKSPDGNSCWVDLPMPIQPNEWNHVEITANGSEITYKVNNVLVTTVDDSRLTEGVIALFAGTHDEDNARFKIDNIRITASTD